MTFEDHHEDEDEDDVPLQHKRAFGSGLHRKPVTFVPASSGSLSSKQSVAESSRSVSDLYLSLVLSEESGSTAADASPPQLCEVCQLPLDEPSGATSAKPNVRRHEASLAHQVCLTHSHPPSALDRSRMGLSVLEAQGWNPDSRRGLGAAQQGMQYPIKAKEKNNTLGIGVQVPKYLASRMKEKPQKLDAGKVRKKAAEDKKRRERLHQQFYGNGELEKYLGGS